MRSLLAVPMLVVSAVLSMCGCSSGVGPVDAAACDPGIDRTSGVCAEGLAAACAEHAEELCARRLECHGAWYQTAVASDGDLAECTRKVTGSCVVATALPGALVTPDGLRACASALASSACDSLYGEPECFLPGERGRGEPCLHRYQCSSGGCAGAPSFGAPVDWSCGVCAGAAGDACALPADCGAGLTCSSTSGTCVPRSKSGEPCKLQLDCAGVMSCIGGACQMGPDQGMPCVNGACNGRRGMLCATDTLTCQAGVVSVPGAPCAANAGGAPVACAAGSFCNAAAQCEPSPGAGAACPEPDASCAYPGVCDAGTCRLEIPAGEACDPASTCAPPASCDSGVCRVTDACL